MKSKLWLLILVNLTSDEFVQQIRNLKNLILNHDNAMEQLFCSKSATKKICNFLQNIFTGKVELEVVP